MEDLELAARRGMLRGGKKLTCGASRLAANLVKIDESLVLHFGDFAVTDRPLEDVTQVGRIREYFIDAQLQEWTEKVNRA